MAVILLLGVLLAPASALDSAVSCWRLDLSQPIALGSEDQRQPICLELAPMCNVPSVVVTFAQDRFDPEAELCVSLNEIVKKQWVPKTPVCSSVGHISFTVEPSSTHQTFVFQIKKPSRFVTQISARPDDLAPPTPPPSPGTDSCPGQGSARHETCPEAELFTLAQCAPDSAKLNCCGPCRRDEFECLERHERELQPSAARHSIPSPSA